ncbi:MAG: hypothetical protein O9320_18385 [Magnetospirillum sp.]|nr:hypothetical protein [Magnetospirillum sp.]
MDDFDIGLGIARQLPAKKCRPRFDAFRIMKAKLEIAPHLATHASDSFIDLLACF